MRKFLLPVYLTAGLALAATGAAAQQTGTTQPQKQAAQTQQQGQDQMNKDQFKAMTQAKLKKTLQDAGFKSIRVVDATYLVQAQTKDGDNVLMFINPPDVSAANNSGQNSGSSASHNNSSDNSSSSSTSKVQ